MVVHHWPNQFLFSIVGSLFLALFPCRSLQAQFAHVIIDSLAPREPHCKAIGDIDGDGFIDVLAASSTDYTEGLFWYCYPAWEKHNIHPGSFTTDMQVGDIDGDGDLDVIIPKGKWKGGSVWWYENPRPSGDPSRGPWKEHFVGNAGAHDVEVADLDGDGKLDVVVREDTSTVFFQNSPDSWSKVGLCVRPTEGTSLGDIDGDGDPDIAINGLWLENPLPSGNPRTAPWVEHTYAAHAPVQSGVHIADINNDGRADILLAPSESAHGRLAWYEALDSKTGSWTEHVIDADISYDHTFKTGDMDKDGTLDIITAEMHQSPAPHRVSIYFNVRGNGLEWSKQIVATTGSHNIRVGDIGDDDDLDIVGANWSNAAENGAPIEMWENLSNAASADTSRRELHSAITPPADRPNAVRNGSFESGVNDWSFYTNGSGSFSVLGPDSSSSDKAMQVIITTEGTNVQLFQYGIVLQPNTGYQLSFEAYSSTGHDLEVSLLQHGSPYTGYGLSGRRSDLSPSWQTFHVVFTTTSFSTAVSDARLMFWLAPYDAAGDGYYFDNIVLARSGDPAPSR
jgi:hypothetical protein